MYWKGISSLPEAICTYDVQLVGPSGISVYKQDLYPPFLFSLSIHILLLFKRKHLRPWPWTFPPFVVRFLILIIYAFPKTCWFQRIAIKILHKRHLFYKVCLNTVWTPENEPWLPIFSLPFYLVNNSLFLLGLPLLPCFYILYLVLGKSGSTRESLVLN